MMETILFRAKEATTNNYRIGLKHDDTTLHYIDNFKNHHYLQVDPKTWAINFKHMVDVNNKLLFASFDDKALIGGDIIERTSGICTGNQGILYFDYDYFQVKVFELEDSSKPQNDWGLGLSQNSLVDGRKYPPTDIKFIKIQE